MTFTNIDNAHVWIDAKQSSKEIVDFVIKPLSESGNLIFEMFDLVGKEMLLFTNKKHLLN